MLLNEIFGGMPLFENTATVQVVVDNIRDMVSGLEAIWLHRDNTKSPWNFAAVVNDQVDQGELIAARSNVVRIENAMKGIDIRIAVTIESAFVKPDGAMKIFTRPL